jgi:hypothetical protein
VNVVWLAELKLERLRRQVAPRRLNREAFFKAIEGQPKARGEIMYLRDDPECFDEAPDLREKIMAGGMSIEAGA